MKKLFSKIIIVSLCLSAIIGIIIFLFGSMSSFEGDVLFTTTLIAGFSITGLCCASLYDNEKYRLFSTVGVILNVIGCFYFILLTWDLVPFDIWSQGDLWFKTVFTTLVLTISSAHISLLLLVNNRNKVVDNVKVLTIVFSAILDLLILIAIYVALDIPEFFYRVLGTIAVITTLGTVLLPILNRVYKDEINKLYNKLVRDKIPDIIRKNGEVPVTRILSDEEYKKALESKLFEEYSEVINSENGNDKIEELADMLEVIFSIGEVENKSQEELIDIMKNKRNKKGGFKEKVFLEKVTK